MFAPASRNEQLIDVFAAGFAALPPDFLRDARWRATASKRPAEKHDGFLRAHSGIVLRG